MRSSKLKAEHLARRAVVYVRQSTPNQVVGNLESQRRQYALAEHARDLGFAEVEVIDDDLGRSGSGRVERPGFGRLFAALAAHEVGAIFCLEASRLSRNGREWHTLLDACAMVGAVIVDPDGVYDPQVGNDRLLLGLKGTLSEYELTLLRQRAAEAIRAKAERGELRFSLPAGLCWSEDGRIELHPDQRVQEAIRLVYRKYADLGSIRQVLRWFHDHELSFPVRRGAYTEVTWALPSQVTFSRVLKSPFYAGAYAWGMTERRGTTKKGIRRKPMSEWAVLLVDHHPGYITWAEYLRIQKTMAENAHGVRDGRRKAGRGGRALLAGLLRCQRCGRRLNTQYLSSGSPRYQCPGTSRQDGRLCIAFGGGHADEVVSREVLEVIAEPALEAALITAQATEQRGAEVVSALELELSQAKYRAQLAERRYEQADPANRLVAPELERRWNQALEQVAHVESRLENARNERPEAMPITRDLLLSLARRLPEVWADEATSMGTKQRIVRTLIEEIIVDIDADAGQVLLTIRWAGGRHSKAVAKRRRRGQHPRTTSREAIEIIRRMAPYSSDKVIAATLNRLGLKTGRRNSWTASTVNGTRYRNGITDEAAKAMANTEPTVTLAEAARHLESYTMALRKLIQRGILPAEQVVPCAPWRIRVADLDRPEIRQALEDMKRRGPRHLAHDNQTLMIPGISLE